MRFLRSFVIGAVLLLRVFGQERPTAATLRLSTDFPGGSAIVRQLDSATATVRILPNSPPDRGWAAWWYFKLEGLSPGTLVTVEVDGRGYALPDCAQFSYDNQTWTQSAPGERRPGAIVYHHRTDAPVLWFAWGPPFVLRDANELIAAVTRDRPYAKAFVLAQTQGGRPVPAVQIIAPAYATTARPVVWIQARQHAWETGGSWVCRGVLEWLLSPDPVATALRERAEIYAVPIMDVDDVERGFGGKNQQPHDQEWDWSATPVFPEVRAAMAKLAELDRNGQLAMYLDLHNPNLNDREIMFYVPAQPLLTPLRVRTQDAFLQIVQKETAGPAGFVGKLGPIGATYDPAIDTAGECWIAQHCRPETISLVMEAPWNVPTGTQAGYRRIGEQLGRAIERFLSERGTQPGIGPETHPKP